MSEPKSRKILAAGFLGAAMAACLLAGCAPGGWRDGLSGDLPNFAKVSDVLYRGAQPTEAGFRDLHAMGVKTVICLRLFDTERDLVNRNGMHYLHISCDATRADEEDVVAFLKAATDPANQPVFVHCQFGCDRSGLMVAAYRMTVDGWTSDQAIDEMRGRGFNRALTAIPKYLKGLDVERLRAAVLAAPPPRLAMAR
jgi:tyrosine-protein phosphatase SIW14